MSTHLLTGDNTTHLPTGDITTHLPTRRRTTVATLICVSSSAHQVTCLFVVFHPPHRRRYHPSPHQRRTTVATLICVSSNAHQEGMVEFIGMLKVKVLKGINLAVRDMLSSDPYVVLTLGQQVDENDEELPDFCKFYEKCHKSKKTNDWIDPR
ncbi:hypothetical protein CsSME_00045441 [Camellia sinensis var. sinensis]